MGFKMMDLSFFKSKKVLVTGHTGFKGSWLCRILMNAGASVTGYSLEPAGEPNLFSLAGLEQGIRSETGDVRDYRRLAGLFKEIRPEIVFHLAAQPIVREGYLNPRFTYETNVMGTVNLLECVRKTDSVKSLVNVTTDKVYKNNEQSRGYREEEPLDGFDPYSNSKSCSELVTHSYVNSFFQGENFPAVSTARAGNVIGGGDFGKDRIIPDCIRAVAGGQVIAVRNPSSIRPYQHVLDCLSAYLMIAQRQYEDKSGAGFYNVGPDDSNCITTGDLVKKFCACWGKGASWKHCPEQEAPHEALCLKLDCSKIRSVLGWKPKLSIDQSLDLVCRFGKVWLEGGDVPAEMDREIRDYFENTDF